MTADYTDAWVCVDCYFAHHYGARQPADGKWYAGPDNTHDPDDLPEGDDETGVREFSWSSCQGCGSTLGGSRHRLAVFDRKTATV